ncbi:hypothetical protein CEW81_18305 [Kluyvera genomosp. 3]|uniref:Uncharacterized protein n=1 Tax=Kluyvera genomosp. 3 TaxID=2774055 RepID=A0A248KJ96_9ENTR|nr:hypothetical protein CEW81_18305 [Kluyvera genomosp. 3]
MAQQGDQFEKRLNQQDEQFKARTEQQAQEFNQRMGMESQRMAQMEVNQQRMYDLRQRQLDNMGAINLAHLNPLMSTLARPYQKTLRTLGDKQNYLDQLKTDIQLQREGNPAGYNALLTAVAGVDNPSVSPKEGAIDRVAGIGGLGEQAKNYLSGKSGGVMTSEALQQLSDFAAAHQRDTDMERQAIHNKVYSAAKGFVNNPDMAGHMADAIAAGGVADETAPVISTEEAQQQVAGQPIATGGPDATPQDGKTYTGANGVTFTVKAAK